MTRCDVQRATELLARCLRLPPEPEAAASLARLPAAGWDAVVAEAIRHGVAPLFHRYVEAAAPMLGMPSTIGETLRDLYLHNALRNVAVFEQLGTLLATLRDSRVPVIALKGAHLASSVYPDPALRPMADLDLLVRAEDLEAARRAFAISGYLAAEFARDWLVDYTRHHHVPPLWTAAGIPVELHWTLAPAEAPFAIHVAGLWERAREAQIAGGRCRVLAPEDLLLHLCLHAAHQDRFRINLLALYDLASLLKRYGDELDWERSAAIANADGRGRLAWCTLHVVARMLGSRLPDGVNLLLHQTGDEELIEVIRCSMCSPRSGLPWGYGQLIRAGSLSDKARRFLASVFPPRDTIRRIYDLKPGSRQAVLYALMRPAHLLVRHGPVMFRIGLRTRGIRPALLQERRRRHIERWLDEAATRPPHADAAASRALTCTP